MFMLMVEETDKNYGEQKNPRAVADSGCQKAHLKDLCVCI